MSLGGSRDENFKETLKKAMLDLIEEDVEFRYALMGLLGFREVLDRFSRLEERQQRLEERFAKLEEEFKKLYERQLKLEEKFAELEERQQRLEEEFKKLYERQLKLEERFAQLEERFAKLEERVTKLEERVTRLEERLAKLEERLAKLEEVVAQALEKLSKLYEAFEEQRRRLDLLAMEVGALAESMYSRFVFEDLKSEIISSSDQVVYSKRNYRVDGEEIDMVIVTARTVYVVEVKVKPRHSDVGSLIAKAELVSRKYPGKEVKPVLAGALIGGEVEEYATARGVRVLNY